RLAGGLGVDALRHAVPVGEVEVDGPGPAARAGRRRAGVGPAVADQHRVLDVHRAEGGERLGRGAPRERRGPRGDPGAGPPRRRASPPPPRPARPTTRSWLPCPSQLKFLYLLVAVCQLRTVDSRPWTPAATASTAPWPARSTWSASGGPS